MQFYSGAEQLTLPAPLLIVQVGGSSTPYIAFETATLILLHSEPWSTGRLW